MYMLNWLEVLVILSYPELGEVLVLPEDKLGVLVNALGDPWHEVGVCGGWRQALFVRRLMNISSIDHTL